MATNTYDPELMGQMAEYVDVSAQFAKEAAIKVAEYEQMQHTLAANAGQLVDHLIALKTIKAAEKETALGLVQNPVELQNLLKIAHEHLAEALTKLAAVSPSSPAEAGRAAKSASAAPNGSAGQGYDSLNSPYIGRRGDMRKKASDYALAGQRPPQ